ncbi:uncharacterized protein LOC122265381 [Penaeus japonicus]|uniref:uncharacterized protein LOC122265381 n=1 Tax=Penaeus japonicus TaxID=27405 RepID=UPI001C70ECC9|nr:uncharacterized protein LOC122265381 [Penaeus japonicus]
MLKGVLPCVENSFTGEHVLLKGVTGVVTLPLCKVYLKTKIFSGLITVAVQDYLPVSGVTFLMGNDLAGSSVVPEPIVTFTPGNVGSTISLESQYPDLFPCCAVTRSMSLKKQRDCSTESDVLENPCDDLFIDKLFASPDKNVCSQKESHSTVSRSSPDPEKAVADSSDLRGGCQMGQTPVNKRQLIADQKDDPELSDLFRKASQGALERFHQTLKAMLKKFCMKSGKDWDEGVPLMLFAIRESTQDTLGFSPFSLVYGHEQASDMEKVLHEFQQLFKDVPGPCTLMEHEVTLLPNVKPIKQAPYRVSPAKRRVLAEEVNYLLEHDLIESSDSEWASPCVLVPKSDGSLRMCTDYRRVNDVCQAAAVPLPRIDDIIDSVGQAKYVTSGLIKG